MGTASLQIDVVIERGQHEFSTAWTAEPGEIVALLGSNGTGKSTLLEAIAGYFPIKQGSIVLGGDVVERKSIPGSADLRWPPERRGVGMVAQRDQLDPRESALDNIAAAVRRRGGSRSRARERALDWVDRLGVRDLGERKARALSGGETQIIALACALATDPEFLLLDEPFAPLDDRRGARVRAIVERYLDDFAGVVVLVSHDAREISALRARTQQLD